MAPFNCESLIWETIPYYVTYLDVVAMWVGQDGRNINVIIPFGEE